MAGFADGEGSFYARIKEAATTKSVNRVYFFFSIYQSVRYSVLINKIAEYLNCGTTYLSANKKYIPFRVTKFEDV